MKILHKQLFRVETKSEYSVDYTYVEASSFEEALTIFREYNKSTEVTQVTKVMEFISPATKTIKIDI